MRKYEKQMKTRGVFQIRGRAGGDWRGSLRRRVRCRNGELSGGEVPQGVSSVHMCNEKMEIHVPPNVVHLWTAPPTLSNHSVCRQVTGFVEVCLPGGKPEPFNSAACRPPCPALVCAISPLSPDLWQESKVRCWQVIGCCCGKKILGR